MAMDVIINLSVLSAFLAFFYISLHNEARSFKLFGNFSLKVETPPIEENEKHSKRELCILSDSPDNSSQSKHRDQTVRLTANRRSILK